MVSGQGEFRLIIEGFHQGLKIRAANPNIVGRIIKPLAGAAQARGAAAVSRRFRQDLHEAASVRDGESARIERRFLPDQSHHQRRIKVIGPGLPLDELPVRLGIQEIPDFLRQLREVHLRIRRGDLNGIEECARRILLRGIHLRKQQAEFSGCRALGDGHLQVFLRDAVKTQHLKDHRGPGRSAGRGGQAGQPLHVRRG